MATNRDYCDNVSTELSGWKEKVLEVVDKLDHMSTGEKEKVVNEVFALHMIVEELNDRIDGLRKFCDINWKPVVYGGVESWQRPNSVERSYGVPQSDIGG